MILIIAAASFLSTPLVGVNADPHLGDTTRANFAAMIVPPLPHGGDVEGTSGVLAVANVRRILTDKMKPVKNTAIEPQIVWQR